MRIRRGPAFSDAGLSRDCSGGERFETFEQLHARVRRFVREYNEDWLP